MRKYTEKFYLAYGSNLNLRQMSYRCHEAEVVGTSAMHGWALRFRGGYRNSAVATIERHKGGVVPVMIWRITPKDEAALDLYEGYPHLYRKETVRVYLNGKQIRAMVYIMNEDHTVYGSPSQGYLNTILDGYHFANFDPAVLEDAINESLSAENPAAERRYEWNESSKNRF